MFVRKSIDTAEIDVRIEQTFQAVVQRLRLRKLAVRSFEQPAAELTAPAAPTYVDAAFGGKGIKADMLTSPEKTRSLLVGGNESA